jgi:excisionase family DNA binding protein
VEEAWLSVPDASQLSGYDADYIRKLIRSGKIEARKVVTVWLVDRASLMSYLKQAQRRGDKRGPKKPL